MRDFFVAAICSPSEKRPLLLNFDWYDLRLNADIDIHEADFSQQDAGTMCAGLGSVHSCELLCYGVMSECFPALAQCQRNDVSRCRLSCVIRCCYGNECDAGGALFCGGDVTDGNSVLLHGGAATDGDIVFLLHGGDATDGNSVLLRWRCN